MLRPLIVFTIIASLVATADSSAQQPKKKVYKGKKLTTWSGQI